jgi:hypothetical protein
MSGSHSLARRRPNFLYLAMAVMITAGIVLAGSAEARSVRVDSGGWTDGSTDSTGQLGFDFNFFGVETSTVQISEFGFVSFGGATIAPFSNSQGQDFFWQNTADAPPPDPLDDPALPDGILNGFRVCWGCFSDETEFQMGIYDLGGGQYAMEFNYAGLAPLDGSSIGYENGLGVAFDMLAALGLDFPDWAGFSGQLCPEGVPVDADTKAIACNNYDFSTDTATLNPGYDGFFQEDPSFGEPVLGRYFFLIGEQADVPEPGTGLLLITGLAALRLARRRSR